MLKKSICALFFICAIISVKSMYGQSTIVTYNYESKYKSTFTINKQIVIGEEIKKLKLIFNDSISFCKSFDITCNIFKSFENLYKPMLRHYNHYMKYDNSNMYKVMFIGKKDSLHISIDTIAKPTWVIDSTDKYFLKHRCREAYTIAPSLDTIFILFAVDIPLPFGPFNYFGAPGLVLEAYNTEKDFYIIAKYIEESVYQMRLPRRN